jgi:hypothetical protein
MGYSLVLSPRAELDIDEAMEWYKSKRDGLEERFLGAIKKHFIIIIKNPESFPSKKFGFRECSVSIFPFVILYKCNGEEITVYSVFNTHQNPSKKPN